MVRLTISILCVVALTDAGFAAASGGLDIELNVPLLHYQSGRETTSPDEGDAKNVTSSGVYTAWQNEGKIKVEWHKMIVRTAPFTDAKKVSLGYKLQKPLELGAEVGYTSASKAADSSSSFQVGPYGVYSVKMPGFDLKLSSKVRYTTESATTVTKKDEAEITTSSDASGFDLEGGIAVTAPIKTKSVKYGGGLKVVYASKSVESSTGEATSSSKVSTVKFQIALAELKVTIN